MYEVDYSNFKKGYVRKIIHLILVALLFVFIVGSVIVKKSEVKNFDGQTSAYKVDIEEIRSILENQIVVYQATYHYRVNSTEYKLTPDTLKFISRKNMQTKNKIYYDTKNPKIAMAEAEICMPFLMKLVFIIPFVLAYAIYLEISKISKRIRVVEDLQQYGVLIEKIKYRIKPGIGMKKRMCTLLVNYETRAGKIVELESDIRYDNKIRDEDRLVDLLIDPNNEDNYYIDFDINRK